MYLVYYVDDFHKTHVTVVEGMYEVNFLKERFYGQILSMEKVEK